MLFLELSQLDLRLLNVVKVSFILFSDIHVFFCSFHKLLVKIGQFSFFGFNCLAYVIVCLAKLLKSLRYFSLLCVATFPTWYRVSRFKQSISEHVDNITLIFFSLRNIVLVSELLHDGGNIRGARHATCTTANIVIGLWT